MLPALAADAAAPAPTNISLEEIRRRLNLDPAQYPDEMLQQVFVGMQRQQYEGLPAILVTMADIDERSAVGLLQHYVDTVKDDQAFDHEMKREDQRIMKRAVFSGQGILVAIAGGGIAAAALVPAAAGAIMAGVGTICVALAGPRIIEAFRGTGPSKAEDEPPALEE